MPAAANLSSTVTGGMVNNPAFIDPNSSDPSIAIRLARRLPYPVSEYNSNRENVQDAVNKLLGGMDDFSTNIWWAKK
jgi:hypothetical protein